MAPDGSGSAARRGAAKRTNLTSLDGANALIAVLIVVQMWLLTAALEAALAGHDDAALPAAIASGVLCAACVLLFRFVSRIDRGVQ